MSFTRKTSKSSVHTSKSLLNIVLKRNTIVRNRSMAPNRRHAKLVRKCSQLFTYAMSYQTFMAAKGLQHMSGLDQLIERLNDYLKENQMTEASTEGETDLQGLPQTLTSEPSDNTKTLTLMIRDVNYTLSRVKDALLEPVIQDFMSANPSYFSDDAEDNEEEMKQNVNEVVIDDDRQSSHMSFSQTSLVVSSDGVPSGSPSGLSETVLQARDIVGSGSPSDSSSDPLSSLSTHTSEEDKK